MPRIYGLVNPAGSPSRISTPRGPIRWHREEGGEGVRVPQMPEFTSRGHNTRNFGISTGGCVTAQWNTLNGMRAPKANKVCYRLLHLGIRVPRSIHACNSFHFPISTWFVSFSNFYSDDPLIFRGTIEPGDENVDYVRWSEMETIFS